MRGCAPHAMFHSYLEPPSRKPRSPRCGIATALAAGNVGQAAERDQTGRRTHRAAAGTARPGPHRVAARPGRPDPGGIVFPGESSDGTLTEGQWNRWTQGTFKAAKLAVGLPTARAYDLRHSFVSLLIHEGQSILEVARQAGHSPQTCLRDYGHLFDEFDPSNREPAEAVIAAARESSYLSADANRRESARRAETATAGSPTAGKSGPNPRPRPGHSGP
jgi:hypothetical protein